MADEDIDVKIDEDTPEPDVTTSVTDDAKAEPKQEPKTEAKAEEPLGDLASQFKELQAQSERDRNARVEAERRATSERHEREKISRESQETIADREAAAVAAGIEAAETEAKSGETEYKAAFDAGDAAAMALAQRKMARAEAKAVRLDEAKAEIEARKARRPEQQEQPRQQPSSDPVEAYIAGRTEPTATWLRAHRDFITDPGKNEKLTRAHYSALGEGHAPDTDDYFKHVETKLGLRKEAARASNGQFRPKPPPAAPVHASGSGMSGGNEVRLTKGEAAAATDGVTHTWNYDDPSPQKRFKKGDPIGIQEMARRKLALSKQGAYDRSYSDQ